VGDPFDLAAYLLEVIRADTQADHFLDHGEEISQRTNRAQRRGIAGPHQEARRLIRPADAPPLGTIRSLAYFLPVIEEVLEMRVSPDYFQHVRRKLERIARDR